MDGEVEHRIVAEDGELELLERGRRVDAELLDERSPGRPVRVESVGLPARPVERENQLCS